MKKLILFSLLLFCFTINSNAQVNPHAIGLRGGFGNFGLGGEISYQHGFGDANRLELDLGSRSRSSSGYHYNHFSLTGIYHWVWPIKDGLNWYAGPGAQLGNYRDHFNNGNNGLTLGVGGQLGIEYDFNQHDVPLLLGLDTRPMFGFIGGTSGVGYGTAFSLRYTF